jgi:RNA polymerase sigma factor (sigma-70 family)
MFSRIHGLPTSRAIRSASSAVENSKIRIKCVSSTFATRAASAPASTTSCTASRAASTVVSATGSRSRRWLMTTCTERTLSYFARLRHLVGVTSVGEAAVPDAPATTPSVEALFRKQRRSLAATSWRWCATGRWPRTCCRTPSRTRSARRSSYRRSGTSAPGSTALRGTVRFERCAAAAASSGRLQLAASREVAQEADEAIVALLDLLERELAPELRALVLLRYVHGFQAAELAEMTGLSPDAVRQRLARGRTRLLAAEPKEARR